MMMIKLNSTQLFNNNLSLKYIAMYSNSNVYDNIIYSIEKKNLIDNIL